MNSNSSTSSVSSSTLAEVLPFEPIPFEQAPFGESESALSTLADMMVFPFSDFSGPGLSAA